eukprot:CAMPEP_0184509746 /NCGR_PEP_ID=MMETSP0198_2-20121128/1446_1 /TAXON_ID=1112570 /ORGANISM="Thraustochytrium sp., Strain LLF1b" /LENGTH=1121 /DNA_ID=CAMNT_0026899593 /DNA_START=21 /DNA_END=3386 /DNA_ORIENTATION=+
MEALDRVALLGEVKKELQQQLDLGEEVCVLADYLVENASKARSEDDFAAQMTMDDPDFPQDLARTIFSVVEKFKRASNGAGKGAAKLNKSERSGLPEKFPALAMPDRAAPLAFGEGTESITERKLRLLKEQLNREKADQQRGAQKADEAARIGVKRNHRLMTKDDKPQLNGIYNGVVSNITPFGCFVDLDDFRDPGSRSGRISGLVHSANIAENMQGKRPSDVVQRGQAVKVKVTSIIGGSKFTMSLRDVDQRTGEDIRPMREDVSSIGTSQYSRSNVDASQVTDMTGRKQKTQYSDEELFEHQQLINSGTLPVVAYPTFDEENGVLGYEETEEEIDIEKVEEEPPFLRGQTELTTALTQVKIVKNMEGSLQRAATAQSSLAKERREGKALQDQQLQDQIPENLNRPWLDPMSGDRERSLAADLRGTNMPGYELPEWKKASMGTSASFGIVSNKSLRDQRESLPIFKLKAGLMQAFEDNQVLVVIGETGSGKSTQMPQYIAEMGFSRHGIVGCTQPRRVAAVSVARRVAEEYGCQVGQEVGYTIRFEDCTGPETRIKYMTDGMLMREYLMDGNLRRYSVMILDEAHERTIHTDVLFALLKKLLLKRKDFKLIVTSATLDADKFSSYFFNCKIITIPGRSYPVEIMYAKEPESDYLDAALITVMQIHLNEPPGDILLFLTGQEEIDTACDTLFQRMKALGSKAPELIILPAYGSLPSEMQSRIFEPAPPGARKLVVATNIAEASITLDGVFYVVDPGFAKQNIYNPKLGMDSLVVVPISQASAKQRAGRAGRTGPGKCFRLYTELSYKTEMLPTSVPELQRTNLAMVVLQLKAMGINDLLNFDFMDKPPMQTLVAAMEGLYALGALDEEGLLTRIGRKLANFPLNPILAKTLVASVELGCGDETVTIVAMLSVENIFYRPKEKQGQADQKKARFFQPEGDHLTLLAVYQAWRKSAYSKPWTFENFIQFRSIQRAQDIRKQLTGIMDRYRMPIETCGRNFKYVQMAIASGFFTHVAKRDAQEGYRTLVEGTPVYIHPGSSMFQRKPEYVIYHELVMTTKEYMRNVMTVKQQWLLEVAPNFFRKSDPNKLNKRKKMEKIEPLFDRRALTAPGGKDGWRLSKRKG